MEVRCFGSESIHSKYISHLLKTLLMNIVGKEEKEGLEQRKSGWGDCFVLSPTEVISEYKARSKP